MAIMDFTFVFLILMGFLLKTGHYIRRDYRQFGPCGVFHTRGHLHVECDCSEQHHWHHYVPEPHGTCDMESSVAFSPADET